VQLVVAAVHHARALAPSRARRRAQPQGASALSSVALELQLAPRAPPKPRRPLDALAPLRRRHARAPRLPARVLSLLARPATRGGSAMSTTLERRPLPGTQLRISPIGLGCWQFSAGKGLVGRFWPALPQATAREVVAAALASGINFFDTAEAYGGGASEDALADAL